MKYAMLVLAFSALVLGCIGSSEQQSTTGTSGSQASGAGMPGGQQEGAGQQDPGAEQGSGVSGILGDISSAVSSGLPYECVYTYQGTEVTTQVKGQKFRSVVETPEGLMNSISDGIWMYSWVEGSEEGMKFKIADMEPGSSEGQNTASPQEMAEYASRVRCAPAVIGDNVFMPPEGVEFQDLGAMMADLQGSDGELGVDPDDMCSICEMIPDAQAKAECVESNC